METYKDAIPETAKLLTFERRQREDVAAELQVVRALGRLRDGVAFDVVAGVEVHLVDVNVKAEA